MFIFHQSSGVLELNGISYAKGYAGHGEGKNNSALQNVPLIGPLPQGFYTIGPMHDHAFLGSYVMALLPYATNEMFGRSGFYIHGDNPLHPGASSEGCIVLPLPDRLRISKEVDKLLEVEA